MARKQDSPEVATEKALAVADYQTEQRRTLEQLARLRKERQLREAQKGSRVSASKGLAGKLGTRTRTGRS